MSQPLKIALGADHGGFELKQQLLDHLGRMGHAVQDCGTNSTLAVDYPGIAHAVASLVATGACDFGIMVDGAGIGSAMTANKVPGVRAAACYNDALARNSREHNDANVLSLGAKMISPDAAREILALWLETPFAGGRHQRRIDKIRAIEEKHGK